MLPRLLFLVLFCWTNALLFGQTSPDNKQRRFKVNPAVTSNQEPNCFQLTKDEADRAFKAHAWEDAEKLYRAAKNCADANQQNRKTMQANIVASQDAAEDELLAAAARLAVEQQKAVRRARQSMATNIANEAQELLRNYDRTTTYRLADFANSYMAPPNEDNPRCVQTMLDVWNYDPNIQANNKSDRPVFVPFGYELANDLGAQAQLKFTGQDKKRKLYVLSIEKKTIYIWDVNTFQLVNKITNLDKAISFDVSYDGQLLVVKDSVHLTVYKQGRLFQTIEAPATGSFTLDDLASNLYYHNTADSTLYIVDLSESTSTNRSKQQAYRRGTNQPRPILRNIKSTLISFVPYENTIWMSYLDSLVIAQRNADTKSGLANWGATSKFDIPREKKYYIDPTVTARPRSKLVFATDLLGTRTFRINDTAQNLLLLRTDKGALLGASRTGDLMAHAYRDEYSNDQRLSIDHANGMNFESYLPLDDEFPILNATFSETQTSTSSDYDEWMAAVNSQGLLKIWHLETTAIRKRYLGVSNENIYNTLNSDGSKIIRWDSTGLRFQPSFSDAVSDLHFKIPRPGYSYTLVAHQNDALMASSVNIPDSILVYNPFNKQEYWLLCSTGLPPTFDLDQEGKTLAYTDELDHVIVMAIEPTGLRKLGETSFRYWVQSIKFIPGTTSIVAQCNGMGDAIPAAEVLPRIWDYAAGTTTMQTVRLTGYGAYLTVAHPTNGRLAFSGGLDAHIFDPGDLIDEAVAIRSQSKKTITAMKYHPSGEWLVTGYSDGSIIFWNEQTGEKQFELRTAATSGEGTSIESLNFSKDGRQVTTLNTKGQLRVLKLDLNEIRRLIQPQNHALIAFTPEQIRQFELDKAFDYEGNLEKLAASNDGPLIRSFIAYFSQQVSSSNNIAAIRSNCERAINLYRQLDTIGKRTEMPAMIEMYDYYLLNLIQRNELAEASIVVQVLDAEFKHPLEALKHKGHIALLKNDFNAAASAYTNWIIEQSNQSPDQYEQYTQLGDELSEFNTFSLLSEPQKRLICQIMGDRPGISLDGSICLEQEVSMADSSIIAAADAFNKTSNDNLPLDIASQLQWQVFQDLEADKMRYSHTLTTVDWIKLLTKTQLNALKLAKLKPKEGQIWVEKSSISLANAYKKAGEFEQGNTYSQQYYNEAIRILNSRGTFTYQEQTRLDTLAALYIQLGNCMINTAPERALEVYKLGLAAYTTLIQPLEPTNTAVTAYANRIAGPIYLQMGKSYLLLNQPDEAKTAFEKADESLATGLNGLYLGHVAVLKGQRDASFTEYKNIDTEDKFALALSELAQLAARIPIKRFDILNISKALRTELLRNHEEWNRDLAAYQYHDFRTKYFVSVMQLDSAYYSAWESNTIAQNWLNNPNRDAAAVDSWLIRQGDATLNEAYYALYLPKSTQKDSILRDVIRKSGFIYEQTAKIYYLNHAVLLTNIGHAHLLLNEAAEAMKFYNQLKAEGLSILGLDVKEVITKDFRDLKEAGIVFPVDTEKILSGW